MRQQLRISKELSPKYTLTLGKSCFPRASLDLFTLRMGTGEAAVIKACLPLAEMQMLVHNDHFPKLKFTFLY